MPLCQFAQRSEELRRWYHDAHVADDRLEDRAGDSPAVLGERARQASRVVVSKNKRVARRASGYARGIWHGECRGGTAGSDQQAVDVAVIVAGKLDNHVPAGEAAGQPDRAHRGFGARVHEPDLLDTRHGLDDQLGQFVLGGGRGAEAGAAADGRVEGRDDCRMAMAEDHRSPRADVIDVAVAVDVPQIGTRAALDNHRLAANGSERPRGAVDAARHQLFGAGEQSVALVAIHHRVLRPQSSVTVTSSSFLRASATAPAAHSRSPYRSMMARYMSAA